MNILISSTSLLPQQLPVNYANSGSNDHGLRQPQWTIISVLAAVLAMLAVLSSFSGSGISSGASLMVATLGGALGIGLIHVTSLRALIGPSSLAVALAAYLGKVILGTWHYIRFIDPAYLDGNIHNDFTYLWDYEWMHESLALVALQWQQNGLLMPLPDDFWIYNKNAFLIVYSSLLYYCGGVHPLNLAAWNSLHSILTAAVMAVLAAHLGLSRRGILSVFVVGALQPMTFIASIMERDITGQLFVAVSAYLLVINRRATLRLIALLPLSAFLAYCLRETYVLVPLLITGLIFGLSGGERRTSRNHFSLIALPLFFAALYYLLPTIFATATSRHEAALSNLTGSRMLLSAPFAIIKGVVGPFPWQQVFTVENAEYMPQDFLQHVLNLAIYVVALPAALASWKANRVIDPLIVYSVALFIFGAYGGLHSQYLSIGTVLLLPAAFGSGGGRLGAACFGSLVFFLTANFIYSAFNLMGSDLLKGFI